MASLSKEIEAYIKALLKEQEAGMLEIQRSFLSEIFSCVPSQINYVLSTRFTLDKGYLVESRRGGGGYVRITTIPIDGVEDLATLQKDIGEEINEPEMEGVLNHLVESEIISQSFAEVIAGMLRDNVLTAGMESSVQGLRALMLKHMLARVACQPNQVKGDEHCDM